MDEDKIHPTHHPHPKNPSLDTIQTSSDTLQTMDKHFDDEKLTYDIIGCAMRVHTALGCGFQEVIYQRSLAIELKDFGMEFQREFEMPIRYKGQYVGGRRVDFLISGISVELKAISQLEDVHFAQAMNYLEAYNLLTGLLINFGAEKLQFHRLTNPKFKK